MQDELKLGALILADESASPLPLEGTQVEGRITGALATIQVTQRFGNPFPQPIELEYLFPLPHEAAVVDYEITIGSRTIKADIKEKEAAKKVYEEAVAEGKRASLLEQRRPNLFSIQIGNVQPGEKISTRLIYEDRLHYQDGVYEFIFPMGITPRYHSPAHPAEGSVDAPVTTDEAHLAPVEIALKLDAGVAIPAPTSQTHPVTITTQTEREYQIALAERTIPNKDFVLRYNAAIPGDTRAAIWRSISGESETAVITLLPPPLDLAAPPASREFIFVVDRSGSMGGAPMEQAKNALRACVRALNPTDTFMVQAFDDQIEWFQAKPLALTQQNVDQLDGWLNGVNARGGTEILGAIQAALAIPAQNERQRYVIFLTDGAVSADDEAIRQISKQRGAARIFTFGIGPSVNRYLLSKMAQMGRGVAEFVGVNDDLETTITRFQDKVSYPVMYDLKLEIEGAEHWDTYPATLPDLYIGEPLEIVTKIKRKGTAATLKVSGTLQGRPIQMSAALPAPAENNPTLLRLWARARIEALMDEQRSRVVEEKTREQIISLALEHRIITAYTSFVAVDSEVTAGGESRKVNVAVPLPDGLEMEGFFGGAVGAGGAPPMMAQSVAAYSMRHMMPAPAPQEDAPLKVVVNRFIDVIKPLLGGDEPKKMKKVATYGGASSAADQHLTKNYEPPIENLGLSEPIYHALKRTGITNINELLEIIERGTDVLRTIPGIGSEGVTEITTALYQQGYAKHLKLPVQFADIGDRLKWLARTQNIDGSWDSPEMTAAALIAFVRAGHTTRAGHYRSQVNKAAQWIAQHLATLQGIDQLIAVRALHELHTTTGDYAPSITPPAPTIDLERAAQGQPVALPAEIKSLDDVRITALLQGSVDAPADLWQGIEGRLVEVWLAVGKP